MKMATVVTVLSANHYDMGDNKGLNVRIIGSEEQTNNKFGLSIVEASVQDYAELSYLRQHSSRLPAKFNAQMQIISKKMNNGKEGAAIALSNLEFLNEVEITDVKIPSGK